MARGPIRRTLDELDLSELENLLRKTKRDREQQLREMQYVQERIAIIKELKEMGVTHE